MRRVIYFDIGCDVQTARGEWSGDVSETDLHSSDGECEHLERELQRGDLKREERERDKIGEWSVLFVERGGPSVLFLESS